MIASSITVQDARRVRFTRRVKTYFIQGEMTKAIKIGRTTDPSARLRNLQSACSEHLVCLAVHRGDHEAEYHDRFKHLRLHGEWFKPGQDLFDFIAMVKAQTVRRAV